MTSCIWMLFRTRRLRSIGKNFGAMWTTSRRWVATYWKTMMWRRWSLMATTSCCSTFPVPLESNVRCSGQLTHIMVHLSGTLRATLSVRRKRCRGCLLMPTCRSQQTAGFYQTILLTILTRSRYSSTGNCLQRPDQIILGWDLTTRSCWRNLAVIEKTVKREKRDLHWRGCWCLASMTLSRIMLVLQTSSQTTRNGWIMIRMDGGPREYTRMVRGKQICFNTTGECCHGCRISCPCLSN